VAGTTPREAEIRSPEAGLERTLVKITVIGTGFIGSILGRALSGAGHQVTYGSRHANDEVAGTTANVLPIHESLLEAEVIILSLPGAAVADLTAGQGNEMAGKLVIDATNQMGAAVANAKASLPSSVRYARAFNTLGGENLADPVFAEGRADMFFSSPEDDRSTVELVI
jgi:8-hydroxy-5-deazaflavin:NADPH oxidoreductase